MALKERSTEFLSNKARVDTEDVANVVLGVDALRDLKKGVINRFTKGKSAAKGKKSIIGMAAKNTFEFPVFVSKSVPLDYAESTCTLLEQVYASYLQMAISMNPIVDSRSLSKMGGGGGYLSKFKTDTTKYIEYVDYSEAPYAHEACHNVINEDGQIAEFDMISIDNEVGRMITEACEYEPLSEFNHFFTEADTMMDHDAFISQYKDADPDRSTANAEAAWAHYKKDYQQAADQQWKNINDGDIRKAEIAKAKMTQADYDKTEDDDGTERTYKDEVRDRRRLASAKADKEEGETVEVVDKDGKVVSSVATDTIAKRRINAARARREEAEAGSVKSPDTGDELTLDDEIANKRIALGAQRSMAVKDAKYYDKRWQYEKNRDARERMARAPEMLDETKIRKLNSLKPLMMKVQIRVRDDAGSVTEYPVELICGVKVHCRVIDAETLPDVAKYPLKEMNELTRNIKYKAGELKFKELLFDIKGKKQAAIDSKDPSKRWYRRLYQLAHMKGDSYVSQSISGNGSTGLIPNAAMIITNNDIEFIKDETKIDLLKGSTGCKFCKELFMMALIVIDQDQESIKILTPDINSDYEVKSLATVRKQLAELDTAGAKTRDIFKLLG